MADNLFTFLYWALGNGQVSGEWPVAGDELLTGGSPRYQIYKTLDGKYLAAAPLEDKFWSNFIKAIGASKAFLKDGISAFKVKAAVQEIIGGRTAAYWSELFDGKDVCCLIVATMKDAMNAPHFLVHTERWRYSNCGVASTRSTSISDGRSR